MEHDDILSPIVDRRLVLRSTAALAMLNVARSAFRQKVEAQTAPAAGIELADLLDDTSMQAVCTMTPSQTEGPYYLNLNLLRTDITEGQAGLPMRLNLHVVRASDCTPVPDATVDVWHNNAPGAYSGYAQQGTAGQTWLRGTQITDANGYAFFDTIYPGWYPGRTTHIHFKIRPTATTVLTSQLYFPMRLNRRVYNVSPYSSHGQNPTTNAGDGIFSPLTVVGVVGIPLQVELTVGIA